MSKPQIPTVHAETIVEGTLYFRSVSGDTILATINKPDRVNQEQLAKRLGVKQPMISRWVNAGRLPPPVNFPGTPRFWTKGMILIWENWFRAGRDTRMLAE